MHTCVCTRNTLAKCWYQVHSPSPAAGWAAWKAMALHRTTEEVGERVAACSQAWHFTDAMHWNAPSSFDFSAADSTETKPCLTQMPASLRQQTAVLQQGGQGKLLSTSGLLSWAILLILLHTHLQLQGSLSSSHQLSQIPVPLKVCMMYSR